MSTVASTEQRESGASFLVSDERKQFQDTLRGFLPLISPEEEVRRLMADPIGYDAGVWKRMADEMGLQGLIIPEEFGGSGYGYNELVIVLEEMGNVQLCAPYLATVGLAVNALLVVGDEEANSSYLPRIASGDLIATLAIAEDAGNFLPEGTSLQATKSGDSYTLSGHKSFVIDGHVAELVLVVAKTEGGFGLFGVEGTSDIVTQAAAGEGVEIESKEAAGVSRTALSTMDGSRKQSRIEFSDAPARLIGEIQSDWGQVQTILYRAYVALAGEQVGGAQWCLDKAVDYSKNRIQFSRPIGQFQGIKHKMTNMLMAVENARSTAYYAGWAAADMPSELPTAATLAKIVCSESFSQCSADNIQTHGGIGFTWEHPAHIYYKRAVTSALMFGSAGHHRDRLADLIDI